MKTLIGLENIETPLGPCVLTVGNFDGVHRGHQRLIGEARRIAEQNLPVIALTFDPHPLNIVAPMRCPSCLCTLADKLNWLSEAGADTTVVVRSEISLLSLDPDQFIEDVLVRFFNPVHVVEGPSFGFGRGRSGTPQILQKAGERLGFKVTIVEPVTIDSFEGEPMTVSSSMIRQLLLDGDVERAAQCLGRPHVVSGKVIRGQGRGRSLGFPTANLGPVEQLVPGDGVYAGEAEIDGITHAAAISIGTTPTFTAQAQRQTEAYILDFDHDLYDCELRLRFTRRLRGQERFDSPQKLVDQMLEDIKKVRRNSPTANAMMHVGLDAASPTPPH